MSPSSRFRFVSLVTAAASLLGVTSVLAQSECVEDTDCGPGYRCEVTGASTCGAAAPCAPDAPCDPAPATDCEPAYYYSCVPGPCQSDADCADDMVCEQYESTVCTDVAVNCAPDEPCMIPPSECSSVIESECVARWQAACAVDADCGQGFRCTEQTICGCATPGMTPGGSVDPVEAMTEPSDLRAPAPATPAAPLPPDEGAPPPPDGDAEMPAPDDVADPVPGPSCSCGNSGVFQCELIQTACEMDAECPSDWTCFQPGTTCGSPTPEPSPPEPVSMPPQEGTAGASNTSGADPIAPEGAPVPEEPTSEEPPTEAPADLIIPEEDPAGVPCAPLPGYCVPPGYLEGNPGMAPTPVPGDEETDPTVNNPTPNPAPDPGAPMTPSGPTVDTVDDNDNGTSGPLDSPPDMGPVGESTPPTVGGPPVDEVSDPVESPNSGVINSNPTDESSGANNHAGCSVATVSDATSSASGSFGSLWWAALGLGFLRRRSRRSTSRG